MKKIFEKKGIRIFTLVTCDICISCLAAFLAIFLRCDFSLSAMIDAGFYETFKATVFSIATTLVLVFSLSGLYTSVWQFASITELVRIVCASLIATSVQTVIMVVFTGYYLPRSFPCVYCLLIITFAATIRFSYRGFRRILRRKRPGIDAKRTMIIGGGVAGSIVIRELLSHENSKNFPVVILDDDKNKIGNRIFDVKIAGRVDDIKEVSQKYKVEEIILAIPSITSKRKREIYDICSSIEIPIKTVPSLSQIVNGEVEISKIRNVKIEDLLGRDEVCINPEQIKDILQDKVVMVTGGGGSIGSELCRQIASNSPKTLIILDIYENSTYQLQLELKRKFPELDIKVLIASVRELPRLESIFRILKPDIVYHAAAHKHVPLMEDAPAEAIKNNVFGTYNVAFCCDRYSVSKMVLVSTDKAVRPTNVMGASKRICEMIIQGFDKKSETKYSAVRFGNVMGSNGSVIPLFKKQIEEGGPVTVTHKDITRFFMTIPEAVSLILQSGANARGGEIFVLDMGEPVKIDYLARKMIYLSGLEPDVDIEIKYTGLRPGEKLYEEMLLDEEGLEKTENKLIYIGKPIKMDDEKLEKWIKDTGEYINSAEEDFILEASVKDGDKYINKYTSGSVARLKEKIQEIVPEYNAESYNM